MKFRPSEISHIVKKLSNRSYRNAPVQQSPLTDFTRNSQQILFEIDQKELFFKKIIAIWGALFFILSSFISFKIYCSDTGFKYLTNYSYRDYDHQAQNWGMVQAPNGIVYVANNGGVLEFDGVYWRLIDVPNYTVRSLCINKDGVIYVGGTNEIGYLAADVRCALKYRSLNNYLPDHQRKFSNVWGCYAIGNVVYFDTSTHLFRWDPEKKIMVGFPRSYRALLFCEGHLFIRKEQTGLERIEQIEGERLKTSLIDGSFEFSKKKIFMMAPHNNGNLLVGTDENGFYIINGKTTTPFPTEVDDYVKEKKLNYGIRLSSGDFALATLRGGLVIMSEDGTLISIFDNTSGLQDNNIKYLFQDIEGNLWMCLGKGISKIEYASPISIHDERSNLHGIVLSVVKHAQNLFVGTTDGLYYLDSILNFRVLPGITGSCWNLLSRKNFLLAATSDGVFHVEKDRNRKIIKDLSFALLTSQKYPDRIWCGTSSGIVAITLKNSQFQEEFRVELGAQEIRSMEEDSTGHLWLSTSTGEVLKMVFSDNSAQPIIIRYNTSFGLPAGQVRLAVINRHVVFATEKGLYKFDEKARFFIPDLILGESFAGGSNTENVFRIVEDRNKHVWFHSGSKNYYTVPGQDGSYTLYSRPFDRLPTIQVNAIYPDTDGNTVWFASFDGLIRFDNTVKKDYMKGFGTLIRNVRANKDLIFGGYKDNKGKPSGELSTVSPYKNRDFHFEFAAPFFEAETETNYRCFLEGYDDNWSAWSKDTKRNYTNLDAGLYTFRVQAKNIYGVLSREDVFRFRILPHWSGTWWAFLLYILILVMVTYGIVKLRSIKLVREKQKLENIIKERTYQIEIKNDQLERQAKQLRNQSEKLQEMDKIKSRFFTNISHEFRTPLTLIMSPLEQMLSSSGDKKQKKKLQIMLKSSRRLLNLINQLLDLSRFDSGKMKLKASCLDIVSFLKDVLTPFEISTRQNKLELEFYAERDEIYVYFDAEKIEVAISNLLANAIKFTPPGGKITVSLGVEQQADGKQEVKISVRDTGAGISKDQLPYIFDRFYQAGNINEMPYKGTGIGLALTNENILLHHGKIDVYSREGLGTEFIIHLPMGCEHLTVDEIAAPVEQSPLIQKWRDMENLYMSAEEESDQHEEKDDKGVTIDNDDNHRLDKQEKDTVLVVEDDRDVRQHIRDCLEPNYAVVEAVDGREGIDKAKEFIPDLVISDIMMPKVDGTRLCRELKKEFKTSHIPIVLLTAKASEKNILEGLEIGADDYITKPFNTMILMARIKNLIDLRRQLQLRMQKQMLLQPAHIEVSSIDKKFIDELQDIIEKNMSEPGFGVEELSKKMYIDRTTLYRKLKALTDETPSQFIRSYRLKRAAQLLKDHFDNVSQVALEVGFEDFSYFAKCFKIQFHQLPSDYQAAEFREKAQTHVPEKES